MGARRAVALLVASASFGVGVAIVPVAPSSASADRGDITTYTDAGIDEPTDIAVGPDGMVWFTSQANDRIGRVEPDTGEITTFTGSPTDINAPNHLTIGADGNVWFTNDANDRIGKLDTGSGTITSFADPGGFLHDPGGIALGPDGNVWFTGERVGRITPAGAVTTFPTGTLRADGTIVAGPDRMWFLAHRYPNLATQTIAFVDVVDGAVTPDWNQATRDLMVDHGGDVWFPVDYPGHNIPVLYERAVRLDPDADVIFPGPYFGSYVTSPSPGPWFTRFVLGADGALWVTNRGPTNNRTTGYVARVNPVSGDVDYWDDPAGGPLTGMELAAAPDGGIWYTVPSLDLIRRVDGAGPELTASLSSDESDVALGDDIHFHVTLANTGTVALTGVNVDDPRVPDCSGPVADLAVGATTTVDCTLTTGRDDWSSVDNVATVRSDQAPSSTTNHVGVGVVAHPAATITQSADDVGLIKGEILNVHLTVTNTGDLDLTNVVTTDAHMPDCARSLGALAVGAHVVVDCSFDTSAAPLGVFTNVASVDAAEISARSSNTVSVPIGTERAMSVATDAVESTVAPGQPIHFVSAVSNDANVPLSGVTLSYAGIPGCEHDIGVVAIGSGRTADCTYTTSGADLGTVTAAATATADHLAPVAADPVSVEVAIPAAGFTDVAPAAFYADAVDWAALFGVVPGATETTFRPANTVTRARFVDALFRMMDHPAGSPRHQFDDVPRNAWFRRAVDWAVAQGLVSGARTNFRPGDPVSRADVVKLTWLMVGAPTGNPAHGFTDVPAGARYNAALKWAEASGLLDGFVSGARFKPGRVVTRGQLADVLFRLASTEAAWPQGSGDPAPPSTVLF